MSSNNSGCSTKSELVDSVRSKAERASQLLQRMGTEPAPPCNYFKRLSVALERRRAVAARELTDWRQKRLQLQEVVWEASVAEKSNWPIDELCRVEADLDAVVGSDKPAIQKGYWNSSEVNSKINDLLQSLSISWEGHELQSFDKCLEWVAASPVTNEIATTMVDQQTSSEESNEAIVWTMISQKKFVPHELPPKSSASLKDSVSVASEDSNAAAIASNSPVRQLQLVGLSSLASATFFWGNYICVDPVRRKVFQRRSDGSSCASAPAQPVSDFKYEISLSTIDGKSLSFIPHVVRPCRKNNCLIIADQRHSKVILAQLDGVASLIVGPNFSVQHSLLPPDDAVEAGEVVAIASSKFGIYLVSLTRSKQCKASLSKESLKLISPVRLSFDQQKRLLVVLDRVSTANVFKIVLYKIIVSTTTASLIPFGNLWTDFNSRCVPSIFAQRGRVIVSVSAGDSSKLISISSDTNAPSTGRREIELSAPRFSSRAAGVVDICCLEDEDSISVFYENGFSDIVNWKSLQ